MPSGFIKNTKNQIDLLINQIKKIIREEGPKKVRQEALNRTPTPEEIRIKFEEFSKENPQKAKEYYDITKNRLENIRIKLLSSQRKMKNAEEKLVDINQKTNKVRRIAEIVEPLLPALRVFIKQQQAIITASSAVAGGTISTAPLAIVASEAKLKARALLVLLTQLVLVATPLSIRIDDIIDNLREIIPNAITQIDNTISLIESLLDLLEQLFIQLISPLLEDYEEIDGSIETLNELFKQYPELQAYLNSKGNTNIPDSESLSGTTNGISNVPPKFFRKYREEPYTDIY